MDTVNFKDFKKLDFRVAKILDAEKIENSNKLIKLKISLGDSSSGFKNRQLVAGISNFYNPGGLIGKEIIIVANLESKEIMGVESQGMLLAASDKDGISLVSPDRDVSPGSKIN